MDFADTYVMAPARELHNSLRQRIQHRNLEKNTRYDADQFRHKKNCPLKMSAEFHFFQSVTRHGLKREVRLECLSWLQFQP